MTFKRLLELAGDTIILLAGLWASLMALIIFSGSAGGMKFVEHNLVILTAEALAASIMLGTGIYLFYIDWKKKHPLELTGDAVMVLSSLGMGWLFVQLYNGGLFIGNAPWVWGLLTVGVLVMILSMNRLFNDLARFDRVERALLQLGLALKKGHKEGG